MSATMPAHLKTGDQLLATLWSDWDTYNTQRLLLRSLSVDDRNI